MLRKFTCKMFYLILLFVSSVDMYEIFSGTSNVPHKGLCQFSLKDVQTYQFDLTGIKGRSDINGSAYLSVCEFFTSNAVTYNNPCLTGLVCFNSSDVFTQKPDAVAYNHTSGYLNVTFKEKMVRKGAKKIILSLICPSNNKEEGPPLYVSGNGSVFYYHWITNKSCPIDDLEQRSQCIYTPAKKEYSYDFRALRHDDYYEVEDSSSDKYLINLCGLVPRTFCNGSNAYMCSQNRTVNKTAHFAEDSNGSILFRSSKKDHNKIVLNCDENALPPYKMFKSEKGFEINSPLSCVPPYYRCFYEKNPGEVHYDLTPLKRYGKNYIVKHETSNITVTLNLCGYLNNPKFPGIMEDAKLYAVVDDNGTRQVYRMFNGIYLKGPGDLELNYTSHELLCDNGTRHWEIVVQLSCPSIATETDGNFQFIESNSSQCVHRLKLNTSYACPTLRMRGEDCGLAESIPYEVKYNYSKLSWRSAVNVLHDSYEFKIHICGNLSCNNEQTAAVCLIKNGKEIVIGRKSSDPISKLGAKYFEMFGDRCSASGPNSRVLLYMKCSYAEINKSYPQLVKMVVEECLFIFEWYDNAACPNDESYKNIMHCNHLPLYNLTNLFKRSSNYKIQTKNSNQFFVLNVCGPLIRDTEQLCPLDCVACMIDLRTDGTFEYSIKELGKINTMKNTIEPLSILYEGVTCNDTIYKTNYIFECDPSSENVDVKLEHDNYCTYSFKFKTRWGCTLPKLKEYDESFSAECNLTGNANSIYGYNFTDKVLNGTSKSGNVYQFVICGKMLSNKCVINSGVCIKNSIGEYSSGGLLSSRQLEFTSDKQELNIVRYRYGSQCGQTEPIYHRETIIYLMFSPEYDTFIIDELENCTARIMLQSPEVCSKPVKPLCLDYKILPNGVNLLDVIQTQSKSIDTEKGHLILNPCLYPPKVGNFNGKMDILGFQSSSPTIQGNNIILKFTNGISCRQNSDTAVSSEVLLKCNLHEHQLMPVLISGKERNCKYTFEWSRPMMCNLSMASINSTDPCSITDPSLQFKINLQAASSILKNFQLVDESNNAYVIDDLCGSTISEGHFYKQVGDKKFSFGTATLISFISSENSVFLLYRNNAYELYAEIWLHCEKNAEHQEPKIIKSTNSSIIIEWNSTNFCFNNSIPSQASAMVINSSSSFIVTIIVISVCCLVVLVLVYRFRNNVHSLLSNFNHQRISITRTNTSSNSSLEAEFQSVDESTSFLTNKPYRRKQFRNLQEIFEL